MKKEEFEKQRLLDEENAKKLAEESLLAQASSQQSEPQELSNPQDNKILDSYTYYEAVD